MKIPDKSGAGGSVHEFNSGPRHHDDKIKRSDRSKGQTIKRVKRSRAEVAQSVERLTRNEQVSGSIPLFGF